MSPAAENINTSSLLVKILAHHWTLHSIPVVVTNYIIHLPVGGYGTIPDQQQSWTPATVLDMPGEG